jgi:putative membrane protein
MKSLVLLAAAVALMAMPALAQTNNPKDIGTAAVDSTHAPSTQDFVTKAAMTNMFEVQAGHLAQKKIRNRGVDSYAAMIVNDHTKAQDQLLADARKIKGVTVPSSLDQAHMTLINRLQTASGSNFLKAFKAQQVKGHHEGIALFRSYAANGKDASLKRWARETVATLQKHLDHAQRLPTTLPAPTVGAGSSKED